MIGECPLDLGGKMFSPPLMIMLFFRSTM
jgi:hypothetical protein